MSRWWDRHGFQAILTIIALMIALWIKQTRAEFIAEVYYFMVSPFQSEQQLVLEDKLTNARILELEQRITELEQQNQQLKQLLNYAESSAVKQVTAPVIGHSRDRWWRKITLGKGKQDGIQPGYTVIGIGGLVGRVINVTPHTSTVLLVSDDTSRIGAVQSRNRQVGYVEGQSSSTVVMHFFERATDVKAGDNIATSNLSKLYPPGLAIGTVKTTLEEQDVNLKVEVELSAPIDVLEWVLVQPFTPRIK